ncbi:MAG: serine/threonine protein kinase, partial [Planctomycetaceae bacterium]|nr:serine/threonine protein kinase [Planctomycetaceae bacterium]
MPSDSRTTEFHGSSGGHQERLQRLGKYQIQRTLGAGGMGTVFLAVDRELNRTVALKVLPKERAENPTLVKRFKSEAQAAAHLEHKNIVRIYEAGEVDGYLYIALEYIDGIDVHELVAKRGVLPIRRSIDIVKQVARALEHASSKQIVHRDIKPANLLIKRDGTVKLADMGLARFIDEATETNITRAGMTVGTVDYMSPEQARSSQSADVRSDIYSLGCTWYHMLTGMPPYTDGGLTEKLQAHAMAKRPDPRLENEAVPEAVVAVMHRMMAHKPQDRYQTPQELLADLDLASKSLGSFDVAGIQALAEESGASSRRKERNRSASDPIVLPPKEGFKPVDLANQRSIDIDVLRFAAPAVLVVALLAVFYWVMRLGDDGPVGGNGMAGPFPHLAPEEVGHAADGAAPERDQEVSPDSEIAALNRTEELRPSPPSVIGIPFPGAEDSAPVSAGVPLIPNWVDKFRSPLPPQSSAIRVSRRSSEAGEFRRLQEALDSLPRDGGVVELDGDGPYVLGPITINSRGTVRLTAVPGRQPVVVLETGESSGGTGNVLTVRVAQLEVENLHFVMVDPPPGSWTLFAMQEGDLSLRNSTITVDGGNADAVTAIALEGQRAASGVRGNAGTSSGRCLLEDVMIRGDRLTAVQLRGPSSELVTGNCLLHSGDAAAIVVTETGAPGTEPRNLRLLATTLFSRRTAVQFLR